MSRRRCIERFPRCPPLARTLPSPHVQSISVSLRHAILRLSPRTPPSLDPHSPPIVLHSSFNSGTYGIPRTTLAVDPDERRDARSIKAPIDSVVRRYSRARVKNLMRADLCANNRMINRTYT